MEKLDKDNWFVDGNELEISLVNFHARIEMNFEEEDVNFLVIITDKDMNMGFFRFDNLEDAIVFVDSIYYMFDYKEVVDEYNNRSSKKLKK